MKRSEFIKQLEQLEGSIKLSTPNNGVVPPHFHITEAGLMTKHFIDCGGTIREEKCLLLQVWVANDVDHRLSPSKLKGIIEKSAPLTGHEDLEVQIEYQTETVGRYDIQASIDGFQLQIIKSDCLAKELCGIPKAKPKIRLSELASKSCCSPEAGCC